MRYCYRTHGEIMTDIKQDISLKQDIRSLSHAQLTNVLGALNQPSFRAQQIKEWIWKLGATSFDDMTNIPKALRIQLATQYVVGGATEIARQISLDGSRKYLLRYLDGTTIECVGIPTDNRLSVCVSTQAGCAMRCAFCATGTQGLNRSLSAEEIFAQVVHVQADFDTRATSVVCMGEGEPFANYDEVIKALRLFNNPDFLNIGARHLTVSTCGVIPMIAKFSHEPEQFTLAVSLHSAVQHTRNILMPGVKRWSLTHLHDIVNTYSQATGRRPSYEYALISGVNDTDSELDALVAFCRDTLCHVNLILLNEVSGSPLTPSSPARAYAFVRALRKVGVKATMRLSRGADIDASCGQLKHQIQ